MKHSPNTISALATLVVLLPAVARAEEPDVNIIIQRSVEANQADWKEAPQYSYFERDREENGNTKTDAVLMILGSPYWRRATISGKPLSPDEEKKEQQDRKSTRLNSSH